MRGKRFGIYLMILILNIHLSSCGSISLTGPSPTLTGTPTPTLAPTASLAKLPVHHADVMIFAAHPDDETLCCATVIQKALAEGKSVHIVIFTNGDGWPVSASLVTGKPADSLLPDDYIVLARIRQNETLRSIGNLGLDPSAVTFLGYPDGGLDKVYNNPGMVPFVQPYTLKNSTYGLLVPDYHMQVYGTPAKYLRGYVLKDVADLIQEWKPDQVYVHSGADWELDHRAVFRFVRDAFQALGLASRVNTFYNDYGLKANGPCQIGPYCHAPVQVSPTDQQAETKYHSLLKYQSQIEPIFASAPDFKSLGLYNFSLRQEDFWPIDIP